MGIAEDKKALRKAIKTRIASFPDDYLRRAGHAICGRILDSPEYAASSCVFAFVSTPQEIDTSRLLNTAWADGKTLAVPLCVGKGIMEARVIRSMDDLQPGFCGILEPKPDTPLLAPEDVDLIIVPCAAADKDGRRLGKGGGFYDRWLAHCESKTILVCPEALLQEDIPMEPFDRRVLPVITEQGIYRKETL